MKRGLAEKLLRAVMGWEGDETDPSKLEAVARIDALANYKYDRYQGYTPGHQFVESLALWLDQFEQAEREAALNFVLDRLIFVSEEEMHHLVDLLHRRIVLPTLRDRVAEILATPPYRVGAIEAAPEFAEERRHSLFLGLSDGARIDEFRRFAGLHNDQVHGVYELSQERASEMAGALGGAFRHVFLIDDFYGSGKSILRWQRGDIWLSHPESGAQTKGRLQKFLSIMRDDRYQACFSGSDTALHICLYIATDQALRYIRSAIDEYLDPPWSESTKPTVQAAMVIPERSRLICGLGRDEAFDKLLHDYYDSALMNEHRSVGGDNIIHGFSDCGLPLVLSHNTPNNSVYLLWEGRPPRAALFPRVDRHRPEAG